MKDRVQKNERERPKTAEGGLSRPQTSMSASGRPRTAASSGVRVTMSSQGQLLSSINPEVSERSERALRRRENEQY